MPAALVRWTVPVTWTPDPATYAAVTRYLQFMMPADQSAQVSQMAVAQVALCDAQNPTTIGTPYIDADQNNYDRNGQVI